MVLRVLEKRQDLQLVLHHLSEVHWAGIEQGGLVPDWQALTELSLL